LNLRGYDVIHLHLPFIFGAELIWLSHQMRHTPIVATYHNDLLGVGLRKHLFNVYTQTAYQLILRKAQYLCAVSYDHAQSSHLQRLSKEQKAKIIEIPNGVDVERFSPQINGQHIRLKHGIDDDARVLTFVGALDQAHHFKGVEYLLHTFAEYCLSDARNHLMIIGHGDLKEHYEKVAVELGIGQRVTFTGSVTDEDLPSYYAASDAVSLASFPPESFGVVLLEAMACGRPVIAHDIPGVRTVVSHENDGFLVTPNRPAELADRILTLLGDQDQNRMMGENGRQKVEQCYAWSKVVEQLEEVYIRAVG
jgi:glycosyltransferase involved in cell wall biosynthesis